MNRKKLTLVMFGMLLVAMALASGGLAGTLAPDAPAESYAIPWWTVDTGGGVSQGGSYRLEGTAGQAEPGILASGQYVLSGGFWSGAPAYKTYIPVVSR